MTNYILQHHPNESGIVYCLTKKVRPHTFFQSHLTSVAQDAETVASGLNNQSHGKIKTGVYHSEVKDGHKEDLHLKWRLGSIKVVCATIGNVNRLSALKKMLTLPAEQPLV
jgi:ATP-dependent DNA helicase Q1